MIAKSSIARRRGHSLHKDHARSDVLWLLDRSAARRRHRGALVDLSDELGDDVAEIGLGDGADAGGDVGHGHLL